MGGLDAVEPGPVLKEKVFVFSVPSCMHGFPSKEVVAM